jgi:hypothetical protein
MPGPQRRQLEMAAVVEDLAHRLQLLGKAAQTEPDLGD